MRKQAMNAERSGDTVVVHAHAKVNLVLRVGAAEGEKGYHPIASWMMPIGLGDDVEVERLGSGMQRTLDVRWAEDAPVMSAIDWPVERDLVWRGLGLIEERVGRRLPVAVRVRKRVPIGGGLGGGSADAAAAMVAANELCGCGLSVDELREMSARIGSDVAFFIDAPPTDVPVRGAIVSGFGDRIERLGGRVGADVTLFVPSFGCATGAVYAAFDASAGGQEANVQAVRDVAQRALECGHVDAGELVNELAEPAMRVEPRLAAVRDALEQELGQGVVCISGSGSTLFAIDAPPEASERAAAAARTVDTQLAVVQTGLI